MEKILVGALLGLLASHFVIKIMNGEVSSILYLIYSLYLGIRLMFKVS